MKSVVILENFEGYPDGIRRVAFHVGQRVALPEAFADLIIAKGHAAAAEPAKTERAAKKEKTRGSE